MAKREVKFESQDRRIAQINKVLNSYGIASIEEAEAICDAKGIDPYLECEQTQNICFGAAIAIKKNCIHAADAAEAIGEGLQAFCIPGSVADDRKVGLGHGNLAARLLREETQCFAFLAGHESFAAAEGAIKIAEMANKVRKNPLRVILNGLGKDAAMIISRINGFTYVQTEFDYYTGELKVVKTKAYSDGPRAKVNCYGADDVREGVAIMWKLYQPYPFPTPRCRNLQKRTCTGRKTLFFSSIRRWYGSYPASRQYGCRPCFLRYDRYTRTDALGRTVRRFIFRTCPRRNDGIPRHGQQSDGRSDCSCCRFCCTGTDQIIGSSSSRYKNPAGPLPQDFL